jgi:hypothetical protein
VKKTRQNISSPGRYILKYFSGGKKYFFRGKICMGEEIFCDTGSAPCRHVIELILIPLVAVIDPVNQ